MRDQTVWLMTMVVMAIILLSIVRNEYYEERLNIPNEVERKPNFNVINDLGMFKIDVAPEEISKSVKIDVDRESIMKLDLRTIVPLPKPPGYERLFV
ncbi:MAG: hypothetical protein ACXACX_21505 [Candidatus Hodarchaeales archaeon]